jgi:hypothetical protein
MRSTERRPHPAAQVLQGILDAVLDRHHLEQQRLVARAVAVVGADRLADRVGVLAHEARERAQVVLALIEARHRMREVGLPLALQCHAKARVGDLAAHVGRSLFSAPSGRGLVQGVQSKLSSRGKIGRGTSR